MSPLYHLSVFIHILAAITWIGGSLFLVMVVVPSLRNEKLRPHAREFLQVTGRKFRNVGWASLLTLVVTGLLNVGFKPGWAHAFDMQNPLNHILWTKVLLVLLIFVLSAGHDFHVGPKAMEAWEQDPEGAAALKFRKQARLMGRITLSIGLLVVLLAVFLTRGLPG